MDNTKLIASSRVRAIQYDHDHMQGTAETINQLCDALEAAEAELTRRASVTDEAVEAAARAMALVDNDDGCFERLDLWNATAPKDRWQIEEPQSYDEEATHWWRKRARAALAAAPVSLEAVKAETPEWEYGVKDYRAPGYMLIGDDPLPAKDRVGYYGTRPLIRRRKAGPWEEVEEVPRG